MSEENEVTGKAEDEEEAAPAASAEPAEAPVAQAAESEQKPPAEASAPAASAEPAEAAVPQAAESEQKPPAEASPPAASAEPAEASVAQAAESEQKPPAEASPPSAEGGAESATGAEAVPAAEGEVESPAEAEEAAPLAAVEAEAPAPAPAPAQAMATIGQPPLRERVSRRGILRGGFWLSMGAMIAGMGAMFLDLVYPRKVTGFGGTVSAGNVSEISAGEKVRVPAGRFWLVSLTEEQGGPGLLALWQKCPHLGCTVPWRQNFVWPEPETGENKKGWFRCPCHGSTFTDAGVRVFGPAPRGMDTMKLSVDENGNITVDTGEITDGSEDNPDRAAQI